MKKILILFICALTVQSNCLAGLLKIYGPDGKLYKGNYSITAYDKGKLFKKSWSSKYNEVRVPGYDYPGKGPWTFMINAQGMKGAAIKHDKTSDIIIHLMERQ